MVSIQQRKYDKGKETKPLDKERKSLFKILKIFRVILQFLGIIPIMGKSRILLYLQQIWCIFQLTLIWAMCAEVVKSLPETFTAIERGFYLCEFIFNSTIPLCIYYMSFVKKEKFLKIYANFIRIFEKIKSYRELELRDYTHVYKKLRKEILILAVLISSVYMCLLWLTFYRNYHYPYVIFKYNWVFVIPNIIITIDLCLYWLALRFISLAYSYLNSEILIKDFSDLQCFTPPNPGSLLQSDFHSFNYRKSFKLYDIFKNLTEISHSLDQLMLEVVDIFRIILILNFLNSFSTLSVHTFSLYKFFDNPNIRGIQAFLVRVYRPVIHSFHIVFILWSTNAIIVQVSLNILKIEDN